MEIKLPNPSVRSAVAYVDGSYSEKAQKFSYGIVLFVNLPGLNVQAGESNISGPGANDDSNIKEIRMSRAFANRELLKMRNVAGEIMGAAEAMKTASEMGCTEITVYHDYEGIAKWCTGEWKTKKKWTKKYQMFYNQISEKINVKFVKVKAHQAKSAGEDAYYNNLADQLAKEALDKNEI